MTSTIKENVKRGRMPPVPSELQRSGTTDARLAGLLKRAYEINPDKRISAADIVKELEIIMADEGTETDSSKDKNPSLRLRS